MTRSPRQSAPAGTPLGYFGRAYHASVQTIESCQRADLATSEWPVLSPSRVESAQAELAAAIAGTLAGVRDALGRDAAELLLRRALADAGLDIRRPLQ